MDHTKNYYVLDNDDDFEKIYIYKYRSFNSESYTGSN